VKIKLSPHHQKRRQADPGHDIDEVAAQEVIEKPAAEERQEDGRIRRWGDLGGKYYRVVTSAGSSAGVFIERVVTAFRDRPRK